MRARRAAGVSHKERRPVFRLKAARPAARAVPARRPLPGVKGRYATRPATCAGGVGTPSARLCRECPATRAVQQPFLQSFCRMGDGLGCAWRWRNTPKGAQPCSWRVLAPVCGASGGLYAGRTDRPARFCFLEPAGPDCAARGFACRGILAGGRGKAETENDRMLLTLRGRTQTGLLRAHLPCLAGALRIGKAMMEGGKAHLQEKKAEKPGRSPSAQPSWTAHKNFF